jgi:hypothetical protein
MRTASVFPGCKWRMPILYLSHKVVTIPSLSEIFWRRPVRILALFLLAALNPSDPASLQKLMQQAGGIDGMKVCLVPNLQVEFTGF